MLKQIKIHPYEVYNYGKLLSSYFPKEISQLFIKKLSNEASDASNRIDYKLVCKNINQFYLYGYLNDAMELISTLKYQFKSKPAFKDELTKLYTKLKEQ